MSLSLRGEGETLILSEILRGTLKSKRLLGIITLITFIALSLLIGDGVITPAISILSAVEGISLIPQLPALSESYIVFISIFTATLLFAVSDQLPLKQGLKHNKKLKHIKAKIKYLNTLNLLIT